MAAASSSPKVVLIAGPNGAGKSTVARGILRGALSVKAFVNADIIARGLSEFSPETAALAAEKIMLTRLRELAAERANFAFETTLASRSFAPWIRSLISGGYEFYLSYVWIPSPEFAQNRVRGRVRAGGHFVPPEVVERRYYGGIANFFELYQPLATRWKVYNNFEADGPKLIASGGIGKRERVYRAAEWQSFRKLAQQQGGSSR